jgi:hypothetical protein
MLSSQEEQAERRRVLANDQRVKEQSGTFLSHTHMDEGGRFAQVSSAQIVGQTAVPNYPAASAAHQIQLPDEPPLSVHENPAFDPGPSPTQGFGDLTSDAQSGMTTGEQRNVGSLPSHRRLR